MRSLDRDGGAMNIRRSFGVAAVVCGLIGVAHADPILVTRVPAISCGSPADGRSCFGMPWNATIGLDALSSLPTGVPEAVSVVQESSGSLQVAPTTIVFDLGPRDLYTVTLPAFDGPYIAGACDACERESLGSIVLPAGPYEPGLLTFSGDTGGGLGTAAAFEVYIGPFDARRAPVPEPAAWLLTMAGVFGVGGLVRRGRSDAVELWSGAPADRKSGS